MSYIQPKPPSDEGETYSHVKEYLKLPQKCAKATLKAFNASGWGGGRHFAHYDILSNF